MMGWRDVFQGLHPSEISEESERLSEPKGNISDISHFSVEVKTGIEPTTSWCRISANTTTIGSEALVERATIIKLAVDGMSPALCTASAIKTIDVQPEVFSFSPPSDPANAAEALQKLAAIMIAGNGWDAATAFQEARWHVHRERCWHVFLRNAQRVLEAPVHEREALLARYQLEATGRFGERTGTN